MIIGLTDNVAPRFPRLGKLRKGAAKPEQGNKPGADLDYFRFDGEADVSAAFIGAYGQQPRVLSVYLPFATPEACFASWKEKWAAGGLIHRCDGQTMTIWRTADGKYNRTPKPCDGGCDEVARLEVILPELFRAGHVGYVTLETHGLNDMLGIQATLNAAYVARRDLRGIEFVLRRVEREISTPGPDGKRVRRTKWIVELAPAPRWAQVQLAMAQSAALALPEPGETVDQVTGEIVEPVAALPAPAPDRTYTAEQIGPEFDAPARLAPPPVQPPARTNGKPKRAPTLEELQKRWNTLWGWKQVLKVEHPGIAGAPTTEKLIAAGQALKPALVTAARIVVGDEVNYQTDDDLIADAVSMLRQVEAERRAEVADEPLI